MVIKNFDVDSGDEAIRFLTTEYHSAFKKNLLSGAVAYFAGRPVGEVAWKKADETEKNSVFCLFHGGTDGCVNDRRLPDSVCPKPHGDRIHRQIQRMCRVDVR